MRKLMYKTMSIIMILISVISVLATIMITKVHSIAMLVAMALVCISVVIWLIIFTARHMSDKIINPINKLDMDNLDNVEIYDELKPFVKRIKQENEIKKQSEEMRREFSANVSHELKTPLTSIMGYAQMINNGMAKPEDISKFSGKIEKESERLLLLINDIIELSNLDEMGIASKEKVDLSEIVREVVVSLETAAKKNNITLFFSATPVYVMGNATKLTELAYNIIDNAIKYNKSNGSITIFVGEVKQKGEFSVKDTGIGIPEEDKERIFERFYRVDKSHSKTVGGTGLGLSIVKHIAISHNAELKVESEYGSGTTMTVMFDLYKM